VRHSIAAVVLAAGSSRRFGPDNKLLSPVEGLPLVAHPVDALLDAGVQRVIVVTGHDREGVESALSGRAISFVHNPEHDRGMGGSIAVGVNAARDSAAVLIALGDMPDLRAESVRALLSGFDPGDRDTIRIPTFAGRQGHPVLFASAHIAALCELAGDRGARSIVDASARAVVEIAVPDASVLRDIDCPADR